MLIIAGMAAVTLTGCQQQDEVTETPTTEPSYVLADLALSLPPSSSGTRLGTDVVQSDGTFRGIQKLSIIPFTKQGKVGASDMPTYYDGFNSYIDRTTPKLKEDFDQRFRYYEKVYLMSGVASFLTYGQATAVTVDVDKVAKVANGSLIPKVAGEKMDDIPERLSVTAGDLSFELETIYNDRDEKGNLIIPAEAQAIADYLTYIADTPGWQDAKNPKLQTLYNSYINSVGEGKYGVIAGSAANVKAYVNELYQQLNAQDFGEGSISRTIAEAIQVRISNSDNGFTSQYTGFSVIFDQNDPDNNSLGSDTYDKYPSNKNLPDGAAVLQWGNKSGKFCFIPKIQTTNTANVSSMNRYTYPAELYYYGNSLIKTSDDEVPWTEYSGITTWQEVVNLYKSSSVVSSNTKAVAIVDPMQYAVARLQGSVLADVNPLPTGESNVTVTVGNTTFPITGLIVSGQYPVNFDFTPRLDGASEDNEHFVYDSYLSGTEMYLKNNNNPDVFYTLVLQTHDYEDVTIILELQNNSDKDFKGENGIVYRGTKFYLAGKVELSNGDATAVVESERDDVKSRVFTQDHTTVISMKVSSLAKAYNVMPNIQSGRLEIGVKINLKWAQATPQTIVFEEPEEE